MNSSVYNLVPIMRQPLSSSCWYTSLQMVVKYWRDKGLGRGLVDPSEDLETVALYAAKRSGRNCCVVAKVPGLSLVA